MEWVSIFGTFLLFEHLGSEFVNYPEKVKQLHGFACSLPTFMNVPKLRISSYLYTLALLCCFLWCQDKNNLWVFTSYLVSHLSSKQLEPKVSSILWLNWRKSLSECYLSPNSSLWLEVVLVSKHTTAWFWCLTAVHNCRNLCIFNVVTTGMDYSLDVHNIAIL